MIEETFAQLGYFEGAPTEKKGWRRWGHPVAPVGDGANSETLVTQRPKDWHFAAMVTAATALRPMKN